MAATFFTSLFEKTLTFGNTRSHEVVDDCLQNHNEYVIVGQSLLVQMLNFAINQ